MSTDVGYHPSQVNIVKLYSLGTLSPSVSFFFFKSRSERTPFARCLHWATIDSPRPRVKRGRWQPLSSFFHQVNKAIFKPKCCSSYGPLPEQTRALYTSKKRWEDARSKRCKKSGSVKRTRDDFIRETSPYEMKGIRT